MYTIKLSAHGNIDHEENPFDNIINGIVVDKKMAEANSIEECQKLVRDYIAEHNLGAGNWTGGEVFQNGDQVGYISYNGRYWEKGSKYYKQDRP